MIRVLKEHLVTSTWDDPATTGTHGAGSKIFVISRSGFTSFSEFGVAQGTVIAHQITSI
ncbi:MAG: hypothetical protein IPQ18_13835 [Saprospiraceae bacterium]|nr:hypothetical protein [Saprospiraceae bacterium]